MLRFLAARLAQGAAIVVLVTTLTFVLIRIAPGDPFTRASESALVSPDIVAQLRRTHGLDRPLPTQYALYLANLARGDFGYSFAEHRPVAAALRERIPNTLLLAAVALALMFGLGILVGGVQGARPDTRLDRALSLGTLFVYSTPTFWLGVMLLLVFGQALGWLPVGGARDPVLYDGLSWIGKVLDRVRHVVLPATTLGLVGAAVVARYQRAAMREVIRQDFIRAARAKGLDERTVIWRHALRNALLPVVTLFGLAFPILLSGSVLVEAVFAWPGLGKLAVDAVGQRDYAVVTATAVVTSTMVVVGNVIADLLVRVADPRTRGVG